MNTTRTGIELSLAEFDLVWSDLRPTALVASMVDLLPDCPAGTGQSMSVPLSAVAGIAARDPDDFGDEPFGGGEHSEAHALIRSVVPQQDALALVELAATRLGGGQFGVSVAGRHGRPRRADSMITWFDTPRGHYLMYSDGNWVSVAPAGPERIAWRLQETVDELGR